MSLPHWGSPSAFPCQLLPLQIPKNYVPNNQSLSLGSLSIGTKQGDTMSTPLNHHHTSPLRLTASLCALANISTHEKTSF